MARTNRHMVLVTALVPKFNSRIPIWFPPGARNQNADFQVLRSSKGGKWERMRGFWSQVQRVYENRICTPLPSYLRIAWKGQSGFAPGGPGNSWRTTAIRGLKYGPRNTRII
jgi:hypothetical protein